MITVQMAATAVQETIGLLAGLITIGGFLVKNLKPLLKRSGGPPNTREKEDATLTNPRKNAPSKERQNEDGQS